MTAFERAARTFIASRSSPGTRRLYKSDLERWLSHCAQTNTNPNAPELESAVEFRDSLKGADGKPLAALTVRRILSALSAMYEAATLVTTRNLFKSSKVLPRPPATTYAGTEAVPVETARAILNRTKVDTSREGRRDLAVLELLYGTGMRRATVATMQRCDLFERDGVRMLEMRQKGNKLLEVEVSGDAAAALDAWLDVAPESSYVFPSYRGDGTIWPATINKIVHDRAIAAGFKGVHPHQFRAAYATNAIDAGVPITDVSANLGHSSIVVTQRYDRGKRGRGVSAAVEKFRKGKS